MPAPSTPKAAICPHCKSPSCYHCWNCGCDTWSEPHDPSCPATRSRTVPICKACQGTGRSSNNKRCHPCNGTGRQGAYNDAPRAPEVKPAKSEVQTDEGGLWD